MEINKIYHIIETYELKRKYVSCIKGYKINL